VKFSFERYKGTNAALFRKKVQVVEVVGSHRVRFRLTEPWGDFLAYYGTPATGAAWIVPKKYLEQVGGERTDVFVVRRHDMLLTRSGIGSAGRGGTNNIQRRGETNA
jgi:ABC-type transport system substrate-binding protein